nr:CSLREA domain-containing protein [Acinetobacter sp. Marseille-Q1620]
MKNYKKVLLGTTAVIAMSIMADSENAIIYVNTFADEDGENMNNCSLREAVKVASTHVAYGGCASVGSKVNTIQLEEGTYHLTRELEATGSFNIMGAAPYKYDEINVLTNQYPAPTPLKTTISGGGKSRILNTTIMNQPNVSFSNVILKDGYSAGRGGALYIGGALVLDNVIIENSKAAEGGAIYLSGANSTVNIGANVLDYRTSGVGGVFQGNKATKGSILAMTCADNLTSSTHAATLNYATFLDNGDANSLSTFAICGNTNVAMTNSTVTRNIVNANSGSIIQFSSSTPHGNYVLDDKSTLSLNNNTIVNNQGWSTFLYNDTGKKNLSLNILAFNGEGKSCRYANGDVSEKKTTNFPIFKNNAIRVVTKDGGVNECELAKEIRENEQNKIINLPQESNYLSVLSELQEPSAYTGFMPMYFPKERAGTKDLTGTKKLTLVDTGATDCSGYSDQRGISRNVSGAETDGAATDGEKSNLNTCDIGSTELLRLTATNLVGSNQDVVRLLESYQNQLDTFSPLVNNPATKPEFLPLYKSYVKQYTELLDFTKKSQHYRTFFADPLRGSLPAENVNSTQGREIKHLTLDNYTISKPEALGQGKLDDKGTFVPTASSTDKDENLFCEWDENLKQILIYRTDDKITPTGTAFFCKYTITLKADSKVQSSAYVMAEFQNIAPYAKNASYTVQHGTDQKVEMDLLKHTNDDGDGDVSKLSTHPNKPSYYVDANGQDLAIRVDEVPDPIVITAERSGPCPDKQTNTCLGGKISAQIKNTLDPFTYKFKYYVYDADGLVSATPGTVTLNNTGSSKSATSGGGSIGIFSILGLGGLLLYRRFRIKPLN